MGIYKECDIRGVFPLELNEAKAYNIGRAIGTVKTGTTLAVGGDVRISTPRLKKSLIKGLLESGADVIDVGILPTPAFYYSLKHLSVGGGVMVTASHNPARYNGFKLMFGDRPITSEVISGIEQLVDSGTYSQGEGKLSSTDVHEDYVESILDRSKTGKLRVVLDCCNGATGYLAPLIFRKLGYDVVELFTEFDGNFPNRDPNPAVYENLESISQKVIESKADFGAAFDGDGDRVVFVDDKGKVLESERAFTVFITEYLKDKPSSVVYDIKSSSVVKEAVEQMGGIPLMERSGHTFIKTRFLENHSALAGEISGHFFFGELGYDDGIYAALKMGEIIGKTGKLSGIAAAIPKTLITPDIRIHCPYCERDSWLQKVFEAGQRYKVSQMDGIRVEFPNGWLLMRKSVTEESITLRIEAKDEDGLAEIKNWVITAIPVITGLK